MQSQQLAVLTPSLASPEQPSFPLATESSPTKRKQCTQMCLQMKRGLSSEEKNCLLSCYQRGTFPIRKILSL